jgi:hypothetical protein
MVAVAARLTLGVAFATASDTSAISNMGCFEETEALRQVGAELGCGAARAEIRGQVRVVPVGVELSDLAVSSRAGRGTVYRTIRSRSRDTAAGSDLTGRLANPADPTGHRRRLCIRPGRSISSRDSRTIGYSTTSSTYDPAHRSRRADALRVAPFRQVNRMSPESLPLGILIP